MKQTSLEAYKSILADLGNKQKTVYNAIKVLKKPNNKDISNFLGLPINSITPRVNELRKKNFIEEGGVKKDEYTKKKTIWWMVK